MEKKTTKNNFNIITTDKDFNEKGKQYREGDLILLFNLKRITDTQTPLMQEWLNIDMPKLDIYEEQIFNKKIKQLSNNMEGWSEEDLKMKFIAFILDLGNLGEEGKIVTFFDKIISASVEGTKLTVKSDFMMAMGVLDVLKTPYFHFQEYKPLKNPKGDPMGQLLEAFLIAQEVNKNGLPMYGVEIVGANCRFVILDGKEYCISEPFSCVRREDLLKIIGVFRKFKEILMTRLILA